MQIYQNTTYIYCTTHEIHLSTSETHKLYATNKPEICLVFAPQMHRKHFRFALKKPRKHTRLMSKKYTTDGRLTSKNDLQLIAL